VHGRHQNDVALLVFAIFLDNEQIVMLVVFLATVEEEVKREKNVAHDR